MRLDRLKFIPPESPVETAVPANNGITAMPTNTELSVPDTITAKTQIPRPGREIFLAVMPPEYANKGMSVNARRSGARRPSTSAANVAGAITRPSISRRVRVIPKPYGIADGRLATAYCGRNFSTSRYASSSTSSGPRRITMPGAGFPERPDVPATDGNGTDPLPIRIRVRR